MIRIIPTVSEIVTNHVSMEDFAKKNHEILKNEKQSKKSRIYHKLGYFFTIRMMIAVLMSSCLMAISVTTTNLAGSLVCMVIKEDEKVTNLQTTR
ncbi:unnamed protein product [Onchocerca flexuosa]|uniref:ABC transporter ATP-binding protein n=1 Tax=Onchocerca flexuosa TaxID=387005 RepID=A0A183HID8_9BILA|nr:unnamed protein product [Onchocerca flexuosa]